MLPVVKLLQRVFDEIGISLLYSIILIFYVFENVYPPRVTHLDADDCRAQRYGILFILFANNN